MKYIFALVLMIGSTTMAMIEQRLDRTQPESSKNENFDFIDFDIDFFYEKQIRKTLDIIVDVGWWLLGYDSHAYVRAKEILNDDDFRLELVLSLLAIEKYPFESNAQKSFETLINEIEFGKLCSNNKILRQKISFSAKFKEIYDIMLSLSSAERLAIRKNLKYREPLVVKIDGHFLLKNEKECIGDCLISMLKSLEDL